MEDRRKTYEGKRVAVRVSLNTEKPEDVEILNYLSTVPDKSNFIKELIKERMMKEQAQQEKEYEND